MPHDDRKLPRVHRHLVECVDMIAPEGLPGRLERLQRIERARGRHDRSADRKAALLLNDQRLGLRRGPGNGTKLRPAGWRQEKREIAHLYTRSERIGLSWLDRVREPSLLNNRRLDTLIH